MTKIDKDAIWGHEAYARMQKSPMLYIHTMWGLRPQRVLPQFEDTLKRCREKNDFDEMTIGMFETFEPGRMLTWQQAEIVYAVELAINGKGKKKISIASGHGIGKSTILAMLILWFLFCFVDCKVPCTAPTQSQMYDVLWAEIQKWILKLPDGVKELYEFSNDYVRISQRKDTWFARARTGRKENPEALAGLHADFMMLVIDEASGVPDPIFNASKSALTGADTLLIMISNYTRLEGYFHKSHTKFKEDFQTLSFNSEHSPIVDDSFVDEIVREHGKDSDEYNVRVKGKSPNTEGVDDSGYLPLIMEGDLHYNPNPTFFGAKVLGIDPSGEGKDMTQWVLRDQYGAKIVAKEKKSTDKSIALKTLTLMDQYGIPADDVVADNFGVGANVAQEMAMMGHRIRAVNVGNPSENEEYLNLRAEFYWRMRLWIKRGGMLCSSMEWLDELPKLKFRRNLKNKIQIMPKDEMRKQGIKSPNAADALMLTFIKDPEKARQNLFSGGGAVVRNDDPY